MTRACFVDRLARPTPQLVLVEQRRLQATGPGLSLTTAAKLLMFVVMHAGTELVLAGSINLSLLDLEGEPMAGNCPKQPPRATELSALTCSS